MAARSDQKAKIHILTAGLVFCVFCLFILLYLYVRTQNQHRKQILRLEQTIAGQADAEEQLRRDHLMQMMAGLLEKADREIEQSSSRQLSDETIRRLAILSDDLVPDPYTYIEADSLSSTELSPERGFILKTLIAMDLDSGTWQEMMRQVSFAKANLAHADLKGKDLRGARLMGACLKGTDLRDALLDSADLRGANLWGAKLQRVSGRHIRMNRADLRWANLDSAHLVHAVLNGAKCTNLKMRNASFMEAQLRHANANGSLFNQTNFTSANFLGTDFSAANFSGSNLMNVDFRSCNLSGTLFLNARMEGAFFRFTGVKEQNWFDQLETWDVKGVPGIREKHRVFRDSSGVTNFNVHPINE